MSIYLALLGIVFLISFAALNYRARKLALDHRKSWFSFANFFGSKAILNADFDDAMSDVENAKKAKKLYLISGALLVIGVWLIVVGEIIK